MAAPTSAPPKKRRTLARREARLAWIFVLPAAIIVLGLVLFPVIWNISLSLQRLRLIDLQHINFFRFEGTLRNFRAVVGVRDFWQTIWTTLEYTVFGTILSMVMGLWAALVVRRTFRGRSLVRGLMLFPYVTPVIAAAFVWQLMLNQTFGIANEWIAAAGGQRIDFLGTRFYELSLFGAHLKVPLALTMVILFEGWRYFPFAFLFILARLQAIPAELDEAAMVDGATLSQRFWYVTLPQLRGVFSVLFLLRFIWTFNKFDDIFLLTGRSAGTRTLTVAVYEQGFALANLGAGAAVAVVIFIMLVIFATTYLRFVHQEDG